MFGFGKPKPQRDKTLQVWDNKNSEILKCIEENQPDFKYCSGCTITARCNRIRRRMIK